MLSPAEVLRVSVTPRVCPAVNARSTACVEAVSVFRSASSTVMVASPSALTYVLLTETVPVAAPKTGMMAIADNSNAIMIPIIEYLESLTSYPLLKPS